MPPATNTGTSRRCGRISWASTLVATGPMWPPASMPSMISASAPARTRRLATARLGAKHNSLAPPSLTRAMVARSGRPPASTTYVTRWAPHTSISRSSLGCMMIRLAERPLGQGLGGDLGGELVRLHGPQASTPKPPAFESAATSRCSETQVMAPPMSASGLPATRSRPATAAPGGAGRGRPGLRRRRGHRPCAGRAVPARVGFIDHADLDLRGRDRLNVDAALGERGTCGRCRHGSACRRRSPRS